MEQRTMAKADFVTSIFLMLFGVGVLYEAINMPRYEGQGVNPYSVPGIVPGFLGAIVATLGLILFIRSLVRGGHRLGISGESIRSFLTSETTKRFAMTIIIAVIYALIVLGTMPYEAATALFVFVFIAFFEYDRTQPLNAQWRRIGIAALMAVIVALVVGYVFRSLFLVNLPGGGLVSLAQEALSYV